MEQLLYYFGEQTTCLGPAIENVVLCWLLMTALAVYKQDKLRCELIRLEADPTLRDEESSNITLVN